MDGRVKTVVVFKRIGNDVKWQAGRDHWWHELMAGASGDCPAEQCDAEDLLFLLYTSGTTGKPKGIMHSTAGYMVFTAYTAKLIFDLKPDDISLYKDERQQSGAVAGTVNRDNFSGWVDVVRDTFGVSVPWVPSIDDH